ncbi:hypothetical protein RSSM_06664 [Rhodopirellula sallentina SM41]|uniref:Uncharacterized protein n=1 Tax=Rhodopirellula sallentina SM41 TaxID=1263870 RepID=M5TRW5_9BACT|nr:hypothetical protein RSSM_06664 [Rhodopirellula sallentina SM41]
MAKKRQHPLDSAAEALIARANKPTKRQPVSKAASELHHSSDAETCGDYPQAIYKEAPNFGDSDGLGKTGFPPKRSFELTMQRHAKWTDVLSSHLWPDGILMTYEAAAAFQTVNLGAFRKYNVTVIDHDSTPWSLCYLYFKNTIQLDAIDYARSSFLLVDILSDPIRTIRLKSEADFELTTIAAREGTLKGCDQFSRIAPKQIFLRPKYRPKCDIFGFSRFGPRFFASQRLCDAIESHELSGLDICENRILSL